MPDYSWIRRTVDGAPVLIVREQALSDLYMTNPAGGCLLVASYDDDATLNQQLSTWGVSASTTTTLGPGEFHPRLWRGQRTITSRDLRCEDAERASIRVSRMLAAKLQDAFRYIEPVSQHNGAYSHELRSLLILACTEVENACKSVLTANCISPTNRDFTMLDYVKLAAPMKLADWEVQLSTCPQYGLIRPFSGWTSGVPLDWYRAYTQTKHDREMKLFEATFGRVVTAMAGVHIMNVAQFGRSYRDLTAYFSPDEFVVTAEPAWSEEEQYVPPQAQMIYGPPNRQPRIPLPNGWRAVPCKV